MDTLLKFGKTMPSGKAVKALLALILAIGLMPTVPAAEAQASEESSARTTRLTATGDYVITDEDTYAKGTRGFFEYIGANNAVKAIDEAPTKEVIGSYQKLHGTDSLNSSYNLENMKKSIDLLEGCNSLRRANGLKELQVDPWLMAVGQANANFAKHIFDNRLSGSTSPHSGVYNIGENLAWNYTDPFVGWYDKEKKLWDSTPNPEQRLEDDPTFYPQVGHYLNIIDPDYTVMGAAWAGTTSQQGFQYRASGDGSMSVSAFKQKFNEYFDSITDPATAETVSYKIAVRTVEHAVLSVNKSTATEGEVVTVTPTVDDGWQVNRVWAMGNSGTIEATRQANGSWQFEMPACEVTVCAEIVANQEQDYSITVLNKEGTVLVPSANRAKAGETVYLSVSEGAACRISDVTVTCDGTTAPVRSEPDGRWSFTMPAGDVTVSYRVITDAVHLTIVQPEHATLTVSPENPQPGETMTVRATADAGWRVDRIVVTEPDGFTYSYVNSDKTVAEWTFAMPNFEGTTTLSALVLGATERTISVQQSGDIKLTTDKTKSYANETVTVTVSSDKANSIEGITVSTANGTAIKTDAVSSTKWTFTMPDDNVTVAAVEKSWSCDGGTACPSRKFPDLTASAWYHKTMDWAIENDVLHGYGDSGLMQPDRTITRAEIAAVLYNLAGQPSVDLSYLNDFSDCDRGAWYASAVAWSVREKVFVGYSDSDRYGPNDAITREQIVTVLWRIEGEPRGQGSASSYDDGRDVSEYATHSVDWAVGEKFLQGYRGSNLLKPTSGLTRAEASAVVMRWQTGDVE